MSIGTRIYEAMGHAVQAGVDPTELWLGPRDMLALWRHLDSIMEIGAWKLDETANVLEYQGLRVRPMKEEGLRVGTSFS